MPERNIAWVYPSSYSDTGGLRINYYFFPLNQETIASLNLGRRPPEPTMNQPVRLGLRGEVKAIRSGNGGLMSVVNEIHDFPLFRYQSTGGGMLDAVALPDRLVTSWGFRKGEIIDVVFTDYFVDGEARPLYRNFLRTGVSSVMPKDNPPLEVQLSETLIDVSTGDPYYQSLIQEVNLAFAFRLNRAALVLSRALLENLLVDLLRDRYGTTDVSLYFDTARRRHHSLSTLVRNIRERLVDFLPIEDGLTAALLDRILVFKSGGDSSAHTLTEDYTGFLHGNRAELKGAVAMLLRANHRLSNMPR